MIFGILSDPRVAVVDVARMNVLVSNLRKDDKPLLEELGSETVVRAGVREVDHQLKRLATERFKSQNDVVDEQVPVSLSNLVSPSYVVEDGVSSLRRASLVEDVQRLDRFELVFFVHVVLRHDFFELGASHVHAAPSANRSFSPLLVS